ncbi:MAG TPA: response regulator [Burkholderiales bacterium]|nr:response regulator [Burkholderiales bacterium]
MFPHPPKVLIIEDEPDIRRSLRLSLEAQNLIVLEANTAAQGLTEARRHRPEIYLVDLGLPDRDGLSIVKELRTWTQQPVIILSARMQEAEKIAALDAGADDYLTKPFGMGELQARIRVALRHRAHGALDEARNALCMGDVHIDLAARRVTKSGKDVHLTVTEYRLLEAFATRPGKVLTQRMLLMEVWGPTHIDDSHYLRMYMKQLRHKLESNPGRPEYLITETGVGYRLVESVLMK